MKIGAHVSTAGGVDKAIDRAADIGAETIQIFASSPRAWAFKPLAEDKIGLFREKSASSGITPTFIHGSYLVNLGGDEALLGKSIKSLQLYTLTLLSDYPVFHSKSFDNLCTSRSKNTARYSPPISAPCVGAWGYWRCYSLPALVCN